MQVALVAMVWKRTSDGWGVLYYDESMGPKVRDVSADSLMPYAGAYQTQDGSDLRFTIADGVLNVSRDGAPPEALEAFTAPNFGDEGAEVLEPLLSADNTRVALTPLSRLQWKPAYLG
jgi:hypothetical protein